MHVYADQVDERAGPERPPCAVRHRLVQVFRRHTGLVEHPHAVVQERDQDPVDDEARRVVAVDRLLACAFGPLVSGAHRFLRAHRRSHDLDQRQDGSRIEEVHADDPLRTIGCLCNLGDRERGRVRGQNGLRPRHPLKL